MKSPIAPTIGRIVLVRATAHASLAGQLNRNGATEIPAIITRAWGDENSDPCLINATAFPDLGLPMGVGSAKYHQDDELPELAGVYWRWMPYQLANPPTKS